ncbi:MAG: sugar ABC transporter permease [Ruminococcaceae bacterium]|nr:sugar ABC transporter permease [Oscillospiraceae bacterium]
MLKKYIKNKKRKQFNEHKRAKISSAFFLLPSLIGVAVFFAIPFIVVLYYSVIDDPVNKNFVGFDNFISLFGNEAFRLAAKNTFAISILAVPLAVILPLLLAVALEGDIPMKSKLRTFLLSPMMVPVASVVLIWQVVFHHQGVLSNIVTLFGGQAVDWLKSEYGIYVVVLLFLWKNIGYNMIIFMAAIGNIPKFPIEAAMVDGASERQIFFSIKLRYLSPSILFVTIISLINSFKIFREVYLLTGNYPYKSLYTLQHYMNNMFIRFEYQKLSTASVIMFVVMVIIVGILFIAEDRFGKDVEH